MKKKEGSIGLRRAFKIFGSNVSAPMIKRDTPPERGINLKRSSNRSNNVGNDVLQNLILNQGRKR